VPVAILYELSVTMFILIITTILGGCNQYHYEITSNASVKRVLEGFLNFFFIYPSPPDLAADPKIYAPDASNEASAVLKAHNSGVTCEPHYCLVLSALFILNVTHFCMQGKILQ